MAEKSELWPKGLALKAEVLDINFDKPSISYRFYRKDKPRTILDYDGMRLEKDEYQAIHTTDNSDRIITTDKKTWMEFCTENAIKIE